MNVKDIIFNVQYQLDIEDWEIVTEHIQPEQIEYNGENYFVGIERQWDNKKGIIYHDIPLTLESIVHELLHIKYRQLEGQDYSDYELFIECKTEEYLNAE